MKTFFIGKIYLYYLNSITDAYLSRKLVGFARGEISKRKLDKRLQDFVKLFEVESKEEIVGSAYTYYFWNGFYDYMYGRLFEKFLGKYFGEDLLKIKSLIDEYRKELKMEYAYVEFEHRKIVLLTPLLQIFKKKLFLFEYFVARNGLEEYKDIPRTTVVSAMKKVQRANILSNTNMKELLSRPMDTKNLKALFIFKASKLFDDSEGLISACKKSLSSASRWDRWFVKLLSLGFGRI